MLRDEPAAWPEVSEVEVVRHFTRLSQYNYGVDSGLYPLGSCTMKYNPKINEDAARLPGFADVHPAANHQGLMRLIYELEGFLAEIAGMDAVTCQPAAGAHGELTGMLIIRAYFAAKGENRTKVIIPDTAHGTNPASAAICNYQVVPLKSNEDGLIDPAELAKVMDETVAAIMITNPNTLGLFEENIREIARIVHARGGLVYGDGANMNAVMGIVKPGEIGVDILHLNLHKTFSTPHGGGGPGAGPVAVRKDLARFLPVPRVVESNGFYRFSENFPESIGRVLAFHGHFGILLRAYAYILSMGPDGLLDASRTAVLNANYIRAKLKDVLHLAFDRPCMHECVFSDHKQQILGITTLEMAKRLMDYGYHPPTIYFPLVVHGAIMIEPTETETKEEIDGFIEAFRSVVREASENPAVVREAPARCKVKRLDETAAARNPRLVG